MQEMKSATGDVTAFPGLLYPDNGISISLRQDVREPAPGTVFSHLSTWRRMTG